MHECAQGFRGIHKNVRASVWTVLLNRTSDAAGGRIVPSRGAQQPCGTAPSSEDGAGWSKEEDVTGRTAADAAGGAVSAADPGGLLRAYEAASMYLSLIHI